VLVGGPRTVASGPHTVVIGPLLAKFSSQAQISSNVTDYSYVILIRNAKRKTF